MDSTACRPCSSDVFFGHGLPGMDALPQWKIEPMGDSQRQALSEDGGDERVQAEVAQLDVLVDAAVTLEQDVLELQVAVDDLQGWRANRSNPAISPHHVSFALIVCSSCSSCRRWGHP